MERKCGTLFKRGGVVAAAILSMVCALFVNVTPAQAVEASITNDRTKATYEDLATATAEAQSGDTILLGEGNYTLYGVSSKGHTEGKNLTFVGQGEDKTSWRIGPEVPDPNKGGTEYNGDYSFDGAGTVTFEKMTLRSGDIDYLGFIRANETVVDGCVINGSTAYWGYKSAEFKDTTFNAPDGGYSIWTYSSPEMTFDGCTFNASGKMIKVYTDYGAGKNDIVVNVKNCAFKSSDGLDKQAMNIDDSNMGSHKYVLNITNSTATAKRDNTTCSQLFGFGGKASTNNKGHTDVYINGEPVWSGGKMLTHSYTDGESEDNYVDQEDYVWEQRGDDWYCTGHAKCGYCGWEITETVKAEATTETSCTEKGKTVYTATFQHKCFTAQTRSDDLDPLGHDWGEPEYSWAKQGDDWYCTAKRVCKRDASHVEEETVKASYQVTTPATTLKEGEGTYTATFENTAFETQTRTEPIAKLSVIPSKPVSGKPTSGKGNTALPQTGDSANAAILAVALLGVVAVAGSVIAHKRSEM